MLAVGEKSTVEQEEIRRLVNPEICELDTGQLKGNGSRTLVVPTTISQKRTVRALRHDANEAETKTRVS